MKRIFLIFAAILIAGMTTAAKAVTSMEETRLEKNVLMLDQDGNKPEGEKVVVQKLEKEFNVDEIRITSLQSQKLGYGEIAIVLAMAEKLPGGITDTNVSKIMSLRQGPPVNGWGEIANKLGFKLGPVISSVEKLNTEAHHEIERTGHQKVKEEKLERPEMHEKMERPDRLESGPNK